MMMKLAFSLAWVFNHIFLRWVENKRTISTCEIALKYLE